MKKIIKNLLRKFGFQLTRVGNTEVLLESFVRRYYQRDSSFFFIQIGANNGVRYDPIYQIVNELKIDGVVIEPVQDYYDELVKNYQHLKNITPANIAIYSKNTDLTMYRVKKNSKLPDWVNGIASLNYEHHKKSQTSSEYIVEETVRGVTFDTFITEYDIKKIDFLQIDVEGYDYEILNLFPFDRFMPKLIHFEHALSLQNMTYDQYDELHSKLIRMGYRTIMNMNDTICYLPMSQKA